MNYIIDYIKFLPDNLQELKLDLSNNKIRKNMRGLVKALEQLP